MTRCAACGHTVSADGKRFAETTRYVIVECPRCYHMTRVRKP